MRTTLCCGVLHVVRRAVPRRAADADCNKEPARPHNPLEPTQLNRRRFYHYPEGSVTPDTAEWQGFDGTRRVHSVRNYPELPAGETVGFRRHTCPCNKCMLQKWDECETRTTIGTWDPALKAYCNDWVPRKVVQLAGAGIAARRKAEAKDRHARVGRMAAEVEEGTWVCIDCYPGDEDRCGFWLARAKGEPFETPVAYDDGSTPVVKAGALAIEIDYYAYRRCDTMDNAIFEPEMEDTVEVENLLHVGFTPESHGQYSKVRMLDADVKEAMAEYDRVHGTQS